MADASPIIGILETGRVNEALIGRHGPYDGMFRRLLGPAAPGVAFRVYTVLDDVFPESVEACDGWLVTGSKHGVYEGAPWMLRLQEFLRRAIAAERPVVGVCFGHQILAEAMGGRVVKSEKGWGAGVHSYERLASPAWAGLSPDRLTTAPDRLQLYAMHQDQVVETPPGAHVLARSEFCPIAALAYGPVEAPIAVSVQPHPEFDAAYEADLIAMRREGGMAHDLADRADASLTLPVDGSPVAEWMASVLLRRITRAE